MRSVTYSMGVSLDGFIDGPDGEIVAPAPDDEIWAFVIDEIRGVGVHRQRPRGGRARDAGADYRISLSRTFSAP